MLINTRENSRDHIVNTAVSVYGKRQTFVVAMEEMSELTKEICKVLRGSGITQDLCSEIADVEIMLTQLRYIINDDQRIESMKDQKLAKLYDYIRNEMSLKSE